MRSKTSRPIRVPAPLVLALLAGLTCAAPAWAQNALGDGRALDRNLRVGSGGRNPTRVNTIADVARYNNAVVTGNAGGGKAFRGYVGYLATDDFRASLGSNDLYSFRRDSASGTQVAQGIRGTDALRYQFGLVTGQAPPSLLGAAAATGAGLVTSRTGASGVSPGGALRSTSDYLAERSIRSTVIGYRQEQDGSQFALTASPLLGVTMVPMNAARTSSTANQPPNTLPGTAPATLPGLPNATSNPTSEKIDKLNKMKRHGSLTGIEASRPGLTNAFAVSQMIDNTAAAPRNDTRVPVPSTVLDPFTNALPADKRGPVAGEANGVSASKPAWQVELDRLSERLKSGGDRDKPFATDRNGVKPKDGDTGNGEAGDGAKRPPGPLSIDEIREMVKPDLAKIDRDVARALATSRPILSKLSPDKPTENTAYNEHMAAGERMLGEAKYFDAEDRFLRALAASPGDPMAGLGRVHAQLGAGLYLSAAMNLHTLFQDHPEMMNTRYARTIQPSDKRAEAIATQMRQSIKATRTLLGKDAALLLAYLGFQRHDRAMIEEGVRAFAERTSEYDVADRTLLALMQQLWVDGDKNEPAPGAAPAVPAAVPPAPADPAPTK